MTRVITYRPPRRQPARESLEKLLDAAETQLRQEDLQFFTIQRVLERAGVSAGSLYARFPEGKEALLHAVQDRFYARVQPPILEALEAQKHVDQSLEEAVEHVYDILIEHAAKERKLLRALIMFSAFDPVMRRNGHRINTERRMAVAAALAEHLAEIGHSDPNAAIQQVFDMYMTLKHGRLVPPGPMNGPRNGSTDGVIFEQFKQWGSHFLRNGSSSGAPSATAAGSRTPAS
jgi:AcrR family transcriptional regulator